VLLQLTPCDSISEIKLFKKGPAHDDVVDVKEAFRWVIGAITFMRMAVDCKFYVRSIFLLLLFSHSGWSSAVVTRQLILLPTEQV
jgi:hypothetical protein